MATKILVGLIVALIGTGLGVYVAFRDSSGPVVAKSGPVSASEGGCCSEAQSCCEETPVASCCPAASCQADALAACAGAATYAITGTGAKPVSLRALAQ